MHFFLKDILKTAIKGEITDSQNTNEVLFTLSAESKDQVDKWEKEIERAGGKLFPGQKNLVKDIMVLFLPTRMVISLMSFIWKVFNDVIKKGGQKRPFCFGTG
jgi:hypothetical protein